MGSGDGWFALPSLGEIALVAIASAIFWLPQLVEGDESSRTPAPAATAATAAPDAGDLSAAGPNSVGSETGRVDLDSRSTSECDFLAELGRVRSAVVMVLGSDERGASSQGTGFHIGGGRYVTAAHVVAGSRGSSLLEVTLFPHAIGGSLPATVEQVGSFSNTEILRDLAVLIADPIAERLEWRHPDEGDVGQAVRALGYPVSQQGLDGLTVPPAIVSPGSIVALDEQDGTKFVQVDNKVEPGMSGGPLVDECGRVVGVASLLPQWYSEDATSRDGFAIFIAMSEFDSLR